MFLYLSETPDDGRLLINLQFVTQIESRPNADYDWEVVVFFGDEATSEQTIFLGEKEECNQKVEQMLSAIERGHKAFEVFD